MGTMNFIPATESVANNQITATAATATPAPVAEQKESRGSARYKAWDFGLVAGNL